jgi:outer membrane translocation and assembly module TamA
MLRVSCASLTLFLVIHNGVSGQPAPDLQPGGSATTAEEIDRLRREKQRNLQPETLPWLHRTILYVRENRIPEKITYGYKGIRPRFGTLGPGSGFGTGIEYYRPNLSDERYTVRSSVTASLQQFFMVDAEFEARRLGGNGFVNVLAFHRFSPSIDFYGVGASSSLSNLTAYSLEENNVQLTGGWHLHPRLRAGALGRYFTAAVGPTRDASRPSTEQVFSGPAVPGMGTEAPYVETGLFAELLSDRSLGAPPGGTRAALRWSYFSSRRAGVADFRRLEAFAERNQLFLNQQRAIVLRARTVVSSPSAGERIPFYLQPQLGGPDELRGFAGRRFYDNGLLTATAEYQWQIFTGMWLAAFTDAGKVFERWSRWDERRFETSYGIGIRFGSTGLGAGRFDIAFSREGSQFWVVFATF